MTFALLLILYALPIVVPRYLPLQDYGAHLRVAAIWREAGRENGQLMASQHQLRSGLAPYATYYYLLRGLGAIISLEAAQKLMLVLYAVSLPLAAMYLLRAFGRDRRYSLLSFPLVYNTCFIFGFLPQVLALPLLLVGLGLLKRYLDGPTLRREIVLALVAASIYLTHFLGFVAFGIAAAVIFFAHVHRPTAIVRRSLWTLPCLALALLWSCTQLEHHGLSAQWSTASETLSQMPAWINDVFVGGTDELMLLVVLATVAASLLLPSTGTPALRAWWAVSAAAIALFAAVFVLPTNVWRPATNMATNLRLVLPAVLLLLTFPRASLTGRRALLLVPALAVIAWGGIVTLQNFSAYDRQARHIDPILAALPADQRLLPLVYDASDGIHNGLPLLHLSDIYQVRKGGYIPYGTIASDVVPVRLRGGGTPAPPWALPWMFNYRVHGRYYHYFLIIVGEGKPIGPVFPGAGPGDVKLVAHSGRFALYRNIGAFRPPS